MSAARRRSAEERRTQLIAAALEVFAERGVEDAPVSEIVRRAGVAQGTFYLYFESKNDIVNAAMLAAIDDAMLSIEAAMARPGLSAIDKLVLLRNALVETTDEPHEIEMSRMFHRPENREVHDRMMGAYMVRMTPIVETIVEQGVEEGVFHAQDPRLAAWFVIGSMSAYDMSLAEPDAVVRRTGLLMQHVLLGLGYDGPLPA